MVLSTSKSDQPHLLCEQPGAPVHTAKPTWRQQTSFKHLQKAFIRYNATQDKHRKGKTWRELLPELEQALTINTN